MTRQTKSYTALLDQLSRQSVTKHFDAYADVPWDAPECRIDPRDPRWVLDETNPLGATQWYRAQPEPVRARIGLQMVVSQMKLGVQFESLLSRGLLELAATLPNGSPEFRYAYHELIEEGQHSLMFQEFVNRSGVDAQGMSPLEARVSRRIPALGRTFPELFFLFVLGGETPIDHLQRQELRKRDALHPLLRRVMQIHVTEEARHLCFARHYLIQNVPRLGRLRRWFLQLRTPIILSVMSRQMLEAPTPLVKQHGIPRATLRAAYQSAGHRQQLLSSMASVRSLCLKLGLVRPALWRALGVWPDEPRPQLPAANPTPTTSA